MEKSNYFVLTKTKQELEALKSNRAEISQQILGNATGKEQLTIYFKEVQEIYNQAVKQVFGNEISFKFFSVKQNGDYNQECVVKRTIRDLSAQWKLRTYEWFNSTRQINIFSNKEIHE